MASEKSSGERGTKTTAPRCMTALPGRCRLAEEKRPSPPAWTWHAPLHMCTLGGYSRPQVQGTIPELKGPFV
jgi:hypothetical protein